MNVGITKSLRQAVQKEMDWLEGLGIVFKGLDKKAVSQALTAAYLSGEGNGLAEAMKVVK